MGRQRKKEPAKRQKEKAGAWDDFKFGRDWLAANPKLESHNKAKGPKSEPAHPHRQFKPG
jgi:hypothetical protein